MPYPSLDVPLTSSPLPLHQLNELRGNYTHDRRWLQRRRFIVKDVDELMQSGMRACVSVGYCAITGAGKLLPAALERTSFRRY